jgi:hypothetical protein
LVCGVENACPRFCFVFWDDPGQFLRLTVLRLLYLKMTDAFK